MSDVSIYLLTLICICLSNKTSSVKKKKKTLQHLL